YHFIATQTYWTGTARNAQTRARWSAGRVLSSVMYSFKAQKLRNPKNTSEKRSFTAIAPKNTAAMIHHALTRAASSEKFFCGLARRSTATTRVETTKTARMSKPIRHTGL